MRLESGRYREREEREKERAFMRNVYEEQYSRTGRKGVYTSLGKQAERLVLCSSPFRAPTCARSCQW